ncbi:MAG: Calx-beta domain-containing protein [Gammaproteobacteria bacterium]
MAVAVTTPLVLAGLPENIGDTSFAHDNAAYTGIDLKKIVSAKETWKWTDEEGNEVTEEGWRNRLESIETIDLRDSSSLLNVEQDATPYEGFRLSSNYFTVTDYIGGDENSANTYKTKVIPYSEAEVGPSLFNSDHTDQAMVLGTESVLNYTNLQKLFSGDGTGKAPVFSFELESIPDAGEQGVVIVNFTLSDGYPDYWFAGDVELDDRFGSTKTISANIKLNWISDGTNVKITMKPQTVEVQYESGDVIIEKQWENLSADILSIKPGSNGTPTLDLKLTNLFANNSSADGIDMSAFFTEGRYFLTTEFEGLDIQTATTTDQKSNSVFNAIQTLFRVEESSLNWYSEDVVVDEATGLAQVTVNLSRAVNEDVNFTYFVYPATYGFINDEDTLEYVNTATGADFGDTTKWTGPNGENYPIGTVTIPAGQTSATVTIPINDDGQKETSEYFLTAFFADSLSDGTYVSKASRHPQVEIENSTTFQDVLNIDLDTLWRMSWDSRTWTIRGDDHDTVRLVGYESNWTQSDGTQYEYFEPFRFEGQQTVDGVLYNVYDLWDARVLIEDGVTVIYKKRDLGKVKEGENSQPDFWYKWGTVKENETSVYGAVRDSYDQDGDTITYSIDENYRDGWLFDIDSATGELTWKVAPDYEAPNSFNVPSGMTDFSNTDDNQMRHYNSYQVKVIGNDGSGEDNATVSRDLWIDVKNVPDYEGYDPTNKIPFFRDMWGEETQFIDDATNQSVKIKGFDLDFDDLTWEITGLYAWGKDGDGNHISDGWGTIWGSYRGNSIDNAPLEIDQNGYVTPKTTLSYEDGYNNFEIIVSITDGKSNPVTKQYNLRLKDSLADGSYEVNGHAQLVGYLSGATVFQDLDNDGIQDGNEPFATTSARGQFTLALNKAVQDTPILVKGGIDLGTGLENDKVLSINANLPFATNRDWGEYSMTPLSAVTLALQNLDRSVNDRDAVIDITKALGFENGWVEGDGNYHGDPFHQFMNGNLMSYAGDWDVHQMNLYVAQNLVNILGDVSSNASTQIAKNVLTDIMAIVEGTSGAAGVTQSTTITNAQAASIETKAYNALLEAIAEVVSGLEAYDGFRLGKSKPVKIIDHEMILGSYSAVNHTPDFTVANGVMTLNTNDLAINRSTLQDALDLKDGAKGLIVEVEVGALPTTAETITFTGRLIDGTDASIDTGERAIEISFKVSVDPTQEIGSANYVYVPAGEAVTVTYTGEDGTVTETTVDHGDVMVTIENPITGGAPVFKVDMMEVFKKGIPLTDLSTYFDNDDGSVGEYYTELNFANSSLQTSDGDSFTKVVAPFSVSDSPTPIAYVSDVEVNESRGWTQVEVSLSKPAESDIVINYKFDGGTATKDVDYWWWSDQSGYRQITFLEGQSNAVINLDVRWDDEAEADETFNIELVVDSESQGKVSLGTDSVTVTIIDDDGASNSGAIDSTSLTEKVLSKVNSTLIDEIKSVLDSNSGTLNSSAATYSEILVGGNSEISDVTAYITAQLTTETGSYDDIIVAVMDVVQQWTSYLRGPNQTNLGNKIDAPAMATDIAALTLGLEAIDLTAFEGVTAANLATAITTAIYTDSGFKFNGPASISNEQVVTPDKTVETDSVYNEVVMPAGKGLIGTRWDNVKEAQLGTSGDDTVTVTKSGADTNDWDDIYYSGGAGDDVITGGGNNTHFIQGGVGDDTLKTTAERYHRLEGGPGDDILSASNFNQVYYSGGTGSDVFVIESSSNTWTASASFDGHDRNWDGTVDLIEFWQRPGAIADFKSGTDKIGLRGDWSNKTIVVKQGTMEGGYDMSEHTILYAPDKNDAGEYTQIIGIIANTFATNITSADFVTLDASYNQTALSTSINFASSITFNGGKNVGPAQSNVLIYNANDSSATTL